MAATRSANGGALRNSVARQSLPVTFWHGDYTLFALADGTVYFDRAGRRINIEAVETAS